jgi:putative transposase
MIQPKYTGLSIRAQCQLLNIHRSSYYYRPKGETTLNLDLMRKIDEIYLQCPFYGSRKMRYVLKDQGYCVSRHRVRRLMRLMGLQAIYQSPRTSIPNNEHKKYPYLLKDLNIIRPNQVWATDITYIPMKRGFMYLVAVIDWYSRKVLSWCLSNTLETRFCIDALEESLRTHGRPEIFNTDQGAQFTSKEFTNVLTHHGIMISMDSKGRWMDNVMVERLWRSLKYECVYLQEWGSSYELKHGLAQYIDFYNHLRPHSSFNGQKPAEVYNQGVLIAQKIVA